MSSNYIKVTVCPGLNLRPSISFVDRMRVEADGRQLTEDVERKLTMVLAKKVFAPQIEYIEWEMNRLAEIPISRRRTWSTSTPTSATASTTSCA